MRRASPTCLVGLVCAASLLAPGCVEQAPPEPAVMRTTAAPWPAPRDAISYIDAAGLPHVRLDATDNQHIVDVKLTLRGTAVPIPPLVGIDRIRAVQAPVHTHDESGAVWLEGEGTGQVTLAGFFTVWGVRFESTGAGQGCVGDTCGALRVTADGVEVPDPAKLRLVDVKKELVVTVA